jgi:hypothetical protein
VIRLPEDPARRRLALATLLYVGLTIVYFACASRDRILAHTPYNHFAHLAKGWLEGRLDLGGPPPAYAGNNDFALYQDRWYVVFPAFPAVLLLPAVAIAESVERVRDGQIFVWLAGIGPALLFLALERLRDRGRTSRDERDNLLLAIIFAIGTVYFFTAEQGTVWFAAHVVGVALATFYLFASVDAEHPLLAGIALGLGFWTRAPLLFAFPFFLLEAHRRFRTEGTMAISVRRVAWFTLPVVLLLGLALVHNQVRFGDPFEYGYRFLTVGWKARMEKWGLFSYHYFPRNLGVILTSLPFYNKVPTPDVARFQISIHGLALWATTPIYLYLLWPEKKDETWRALLLTVLLVALPSLFYQNTGQSQFGYRFSNDFAPFLFALLAVTRRRLTATFWALAAVGIAVNLFGALSFEHAGGARYFAVDRTYSVYQPD